MGELISSDSKTASCLKIELYSLETKVSNYETDNVLVAWTDLQMNREVNPDRSRYPILSYIQPESDNSVLILSWK